MFSLPYTLDKTKDIFPYFFAELKIVRNSSTILICLWMTASLLKDYFLAPTLVELTGVVILCLCMHIYIGIDPAGRYLSYISAMSHFFLKWSEVTGKL